MDVRMISKKRKIFVVCSLTISLLFSCISSNREKGEISFINESVSKAKKSNKILILEFWAPECGTCIRLKREIFDNEKTREFLDKNFILIQLSPKDSEYKDLRKHFNLVYQSSVVFINKHGNEIERTIGYDGNREAYLNFLKDVSEGKHLFKEVYTNYKKDSLNVESNYLFANKLYFKYQLKDAITHYNKVLLFDPKDTKGYNDECKFKIAESKLILSGDFELMKEYVMTEHENKYCPKAYEYLIKDLIDKNEKINCIALCNKALFKYPESWEILNIYAWTIFVFKIKKDYKKGVRMAQKSISLNPDRPDTYSTEAWIHYEMGEKEKAIQLQSKAIELNSNPRYLDDLKKFKSL